MTSCPETSEQETPGRRIQRLLGQGEVARALREAEAASLAKGNHDTECLYLLAVCQRYSGQVGAAFTTLKQLEAIDADFSRLWQERGHLHSQQHQTPEALVAYRQAVRLNPSLHASWQAIASSATGAERDSALRQLHYLQNLPRELRTASSYLHDHKPAMAEPICRAFLQRHRHHPEAMRLLALIALQYHIYDEAQFLLESVIEFYPDNTMARFSLVETLKKRHKFNAAYTQAKSLFDTAPDDPACAILLANQALAAGDLSSAIELYQRFAERAPEPETVHLSIGHAHKTAGRQADAISSYRRAYQCRTDFGDAYWSLANLKTFRFENDEIQAMEQQVSRPQVRETDRIHFCFALGKALEDMQDYQRSYSYYEQGNLLMKKVSRYSADWMSGEMRMQRKVFTPRLIAGLQSAGCEKADPIFIVGLPRSGSTLLEQILSSHSQVDGTHELPNILTLSQRLRRAAGEGYPEIIRTLEPRQFHEYGKEYLQQTAGYRKGAPFFIDKMPNNFRHIGLIKTILPNAKIIDARRHPMACGFSLFKQLFAEGQEFSYSLRDIGRYYRDYVQLMNHWHQVFPDQVLHVQYEDVVADLEQQVRRILDYCNLPFEDACLDFHKTERAVKTASSEQVRQPIFNNGLAQWKFFSNHLDELRQALGETLASCPEDRSAHGKSL